MLDDNNAILRWLLVKQVKMSSLPVLAEEFEGKC